MKDYYIYIYLDPRKTGNFNYQELYFNYEPFYVGKGRADRIDKSFKDNSNVFKTNKVNKIIDDGFNVLKMKIYQDLTESEAFEKEVQTISKIGKLIDGVGPLVNFNDGGYGGDNISNHPNYDLIIEKMSLSQSGNNNGFFNKKHSDISKTKMSEIAKERKGEKNSFFGKKHSEETKRTISEKNRISNLGELNPFFGKNHSDQTKQKISEKKLGTQLSCETKSKISRSLKLKGFSGKKNPMATRYIVEDPEGNILEFEGRDELKSGLKGKNPEKILKGSHNGYKLIDKIKINQDI